MSFVVELFNFSKKENSTKQPDRTSATSFNCTLKKDSGLLNPIIQLDIGLSQAPNYNYAYIPAYDRYYFVKEWVNRQPLWEVALQCDVLATYKNDIGSADLYVLRASNAYDGAVIDTLYPMKTQRTLQKQTANNPYSNDAIGAVGMNSGIFVLQIAGEGFNKLIGMTATQVTTLVNTLANSYVTTLNDFSADDASLALQASLVDPFSFIKACTWVPVPVSSLGTIQRGLTIGTIDFPSLAYYLMPAVFPIETVTYFALAKHPQASARGTYLNTYATTYRLFIPPFGYFTLDSDIASQYTYVGIIYEVDCVNGNGRAKIFYSNTIPNYSNIQFIENIINSSLGVSIQLSQIYRNAVGGTMATLSSIGSALTGNVFGAVGGMMSAVDAMSPKLETVGSPEGFVYLQGVPTLNTEFLIAVDDDIDHNGRPLCQIRKPNALNGYMLIQDGDIDATGATADELQQIRAYLEGGFYYE